MISKVQIMLAIESFARRVERCMGYKEADRRYRDFIKEHRRLIRDFLRNEPVVGIFFALLRPLILMRTMEIPRLVPDMDELLSYPEGTFARELAEFYPRNGVALYHVGSCRQQLHEMTHVLLGYDISPEGEQQLQAFMVGSLRFATCGIAPYVFHIAPLVYLAVLCRGLNLKQTSKAFMRARKSSFDLEHIDTSTIWSSSRAELLLRFGL